jgi:mRNA interferase RelE/StbE
MYKLTFLSSAKKEFAKLDIITQKLIKNKLLILAQNPDALKNNIKPLKGLYSGKYRLRVNNYRVIYSIVEDELIITIVRIGHRKEVY